MKHIFLISTCYILFLLVNHVAAEVQTTNLEGKWMVDSIQIAKTQNNQTVHYTSTAKRKQQSFSDQPVSIVLYAVDVTIHYANDFSEQGVYDLNGDQINIRLNNGPLDYHYTLLKTNILKLVQTVNYIVDGVDQVTEQYAIYLRRQ